MKNDFIYIKFVEDKVVNRMPPDETIVEVKMDDGEVRKAWFAANIMEAGDWDFLSVSDDDEPLIDGDSLADHVIAWRPLESRP